MIRCNRLLINSVLIILLSICMTSMCFTASAENYVDTIITIKSDGQKVDTFAGVPAYYVTTPSDTGYYCCAGYVSRFYEEKFGVTVYNINMVDDKPSVYSYGKKCELKTVTTPKPGDIMQTKTYSHVAIVKAVSSSDVTLIEQNYKWTYNNTIYAEINRKVIASNNYFYRLYIDGKEQSVSSSTAVSTVDKTAPTVSSYKSYSVTNNGYKLSASLSDNKKVTKVTVTSYPKNNPSDKAIVTYNNPSAAFTANVKSKVFSRANGNYVSTLTAYDAAGNKTSKTVTTYVDTQSPAISGAVAASITNEGYKVNAKLSDNVKLLKVVVTSYPKNNPTAKAVVTYNKLSASFTANVKSKVFDRANGDYVSTVVAYDTAGNTATKTVSTYVDTVNPSISSVKVSDVTAKGYNIQCTVKDNKGVKTVAFPTWTTSNASTDNVTHKASVSNTTATGFISSDVHKNKSGTYSTKITVSDKYGNVATKTVKTAIKPASAVSINQKATKVSVGKDITLKAVMSGGNNLTDYVVWSSANSSIAKVTNGKITAEQIGKTTVTAETTGGKSDSCQITVTGDISTASASLPATIVYSASKNAPIPAVIYNGKNLVNKTDFTVSYTALGKVGTATAKITGIGLYTGTISLTYKIIPDAPKNLKITSNTVNSISLSWTKATGATYYKVYKYSGKSWALVNKTTAASMKITKLTDAGILTYRVCAFADVSGKTYSSTYSNNVSGTLLPSTVTCKASSTTKGNTSLSWTASTGASGYEVYTSTDSKSYSLKKTTSARSLSLTKLKSKSLLFVKVRAYKIKDGKKIYGAFSKSVMIIIK